MPPRLGQLAHQFRQRTAAEWDADDPVLLQGEVGWATDARVGKIGNGTSTWTALPIVLGDVSPVVVMDDLGVADDAPLAGRVPYRGLPWIEHSSSASSLIGTSSDDSIESDGAGLAICLSDVSPLTVDARVAIYTGTAPANGYVRSGVLVRANTGSLTGVVGVYERNDSGEHWVRIIQYVAGSPTTLKEAQVPWVGDGWELELRLRAIGDHYVLSLWEGVQLEVSDDTLEDNNGGVGPWRDVEDAADIAELPMWDFIARSGDEDVEPAPHEHAPEHIPSLREWLDGVLTGFDFGIAPAIDTSGFGLVNGGSSFPDGFGLLRFALVSAGDNDTDWHLFTSAFPDAGDTTFRAYAQLIHWSDDNVQGALVLRESGTGKLLVVEVDYNGGSPLVALRTYTGPTDTSPTTIASVAVPSLCGLKVFARFDWSGSTITVTLDAGEDFGVWSLALGSVAKTTAFTTAPDQVGVGIRNNSSATVAVGFGELQTG